MERGLSITAIFINQVYTDWTCLVSDKEQISYDGQKQWFSDCAWQKVFPAKNLSQ